MIRRLAAAALVLLALAALLAAAPSGAAAADRPAARPGDRPNVVVVMTDDQTVESLRVMEQVDRLLVSDGVTFDNSFVSYPLCCPSRATLLTGQYSHNNGVQSNSPPSGGYGALDGTNTLPVWLQDAGYHTTHIGKYLNGYGRQDPGEVPPGYDDWQGLVDPTTYRFYDYTLNDNGTLVTYGSAPADYQTDVLTGRAVDVVQERGEAGQPFYLNVSYLAPHDDSAGDDPTDGPLPAPRHEGAYVDEPLPRPASFNEADVSDKPAVIRARPLLDDDAVAGIEERYRSRLASLVAVDEGIAAIIGALEETRQLADTYVVLTSDNGFFHGEHRVPSSKLLVHEPSSRVPLVIRGPGVPEGATATTLVSNVDLAPTVVELTGATAGLEVDGRSLLPLLERPSREWDRDLLIQTGPGLPTAYRYTAVRTEDWLYAEYAGGARELYDMAADPDQLESRHADPAYADVRADLAARLAELRTCVGATCR